ncbi:hypothetical protein GCM10023221_24050 [Luteimicrobium xylanilyticum]|uniref:Uncharacterized protein n=1 Tax=Luteimicrobium xylanilyticum TaxID=1133546 RepID=A0A5P9Q5K9_9MICO|nr:hypothetical protein [Luteimicrobium xylanilyticum]QFU96668.1 hypothetical protein KDY119_00155 [Luteimicrobium xylanilyticum]
MSPEQPVSPGAPAPDDAPSPRVDLVAPPFPGLVRVAGPAAGDTPGLVVVAGADGADAVGVCVDGVCVVPPQLSD